MLKRLELQGFKSFAEKTVLEFPPGITAIVGPNGSGKSNVVDAIRWVLGEQSLKHIRLGKSEDVIFSGTPGHAASGFASVTLVFDNSKRLFPQELAEIAVGRKLYRDGESAYFLNRQDVRLKDIVRLMAAGKLGTRGLAIITQGAGDAFLAASMSERREMLEEAIGLKEYRFKKEEAERKIEETKSNLDKVASLLEELAPHVRSLKRQVARWERRNEKAEALRLLQEQYFHWKLCQIEEGAAVADERSAVEREVKELEKQIRELEASRKSAEDALARIQQAGTEEREALDRISRERQDVLRLLGNIEGKIEALGVASARPYPSAEVLGALIEKIKAEILALLETNDWGRAKAALKNLVAEIDRVLAASSEPGSADRNAMLERERQALAEKLGALEEEFARLEKSADEARKERERAYEAVRKVLRELDEKRKALAEKQGILQEYRFEGERRRLQEEDLAAKIREAGWDYEEFRAGHRERAAPDIGAPGEVETRILRLRRELADIGSVDEELVSEYREAEARHAFLTAQKADLEAALMDLEKLQKELEKKIDQEFSAALKGISAQFQHYFRLLFGGGSAKIFEHRPKLKPLAHPEGGAILEGREDEYAIQEIPEPETAGISVDVDLPRKKVKSLDMLSGGERALTAIALIFAVVGVSSPPFLVLDEIDAPLDEANSERFGRLLKELAGKTQFVLITHNRVTMEAADALYGVTMADGVSKIFSLKFAEAEKLATKDVHPVSGKTP